MSQRPSSLKHTALLTALGSLTLAASGLLSGCGAGLTASPVDSYVSGVKGVLHGGQSPIQGATVTLYVTSPSTTTYGAAATKIGTGTTDQNGAFTIATPATTSNCPAGQQAYVTSVGGYQSGQPTTTNSSVLLMAALGDCGTPINANTYVTINEVTTVAAAYALSGFMTTSGTGSTLTANVSAPAANRVSTADSTDASGLQHAFLNAANLAAFATGTANSGTTAAAVAGASVVGSVPAAEINTLGDILQSCVNSTLTATTPSTPCATLFADTPSISSKAPTNTLQAMINLARNPYPSAAAMSTASGNTSLFSLVPASGAAFVPSLTAAPPDWSMAIRWPLTTTPYYLTLDDNDTVYYGASSATTIVALSAYGNATPAFTAATGVGSATRQIAADALGNVWGVSSTTGFLQYNAGTGALTHSTTVTGGSLYGVAVDRSNNVWVSNGITGSSTVANLSEYAYSAGVGSAAASYAVNYTAYVPGGFQPDSVAIDQNQNIWVAPYYTNANIAAVLPNTNVGTPAGTAPAYGTVGTPSAMVSVTLNGTTPKPIGLTFDATGDAWYGITGSNSVTTTGLEQVLPNTFTAPITSLSAAPLETGSVLGATAAQIPGIDGAGTIFFPDNANSGASGFHAYSTTSGTTSSATGSAVISPPAGYLGCYLPAATPTTCGSGTTSAVYNPRSAVIDSTGSLWGGVTSGGLTQIIGIAAPSYPLLSSGKPSLSPGLTTVQALP